MECALARRQLKEASSSTGSGPRFVIYERLAEREVAEDGEDNMKAYGRKTQCKDRLIDELERLLYELCIIFPTHLL